MARINQADVEELKQLVADIKIGRGGIPGDLVEALVFDIANRSTARSMSSEARNSLHFTLSWLKGAYREAKDALEPVRENGCDVSQVLFTIARLGYLAGSLCPDKMFTENRTAVPREKTTGRKPKWHSVADTFLPDALLSKIRNKRPSADNAAEKILPNLNQTLSEKGMRPVSQRTLRDYIGKKVGKQRT